MKPLKHIKLLFVSLFMASALFSCKKLNKEETTVYFSIYNPISGKGMSGVSVKIIEQKDVTPPLKLQNKYESKIIWEGTTDANGKASCSFKTLKSDKYTYWHSVDESFMNDEKIITQPDYGPVSKNAPNTMTYKVVRDNINVIVWRKNDMIYEIIKKLSSYEKCNYCGLVLGF